MDQHKLNFIQHELKDWGDKVIHELESQLGKRDIKHSGDLLKSLSYQVYQGSEYHQGELQLSFAEWGRMVDMGAGRKPKIENTQTNGEYFQTKRKPKPFYSTTVYRLLNLLYSNVSYGYQQEAISQMKNNIINKDL